MMLCTLLNRPYTIQTVILVEPRAKLCRPVGPKTRFLTRWPSKGYKVPWRRSFEDNKPHRSARRGRFP